VTRSRRSLDAWQRTRLGTRLALGLGALTLVVLAVVGVTTVGIMHGYLDRRLDAQLTNSQVRQVDELRISHGTPQPSYSWYSGVFEVEGGMASPKAGSLLPQDLHELSQAASDATTTQILRTVSISNQGTTGCVPARSTTARCWSAPRPLNDLDQTVNQLVIVEAVAFLLALAVLVIAGRLVLRRGLRPLSEMAGTAQNIATRDLTESANLPVRASGSGGGARSRSCARRST
jgi:two-component system OmpR family sensor kinase